jgi:chromosome segregation ATPase
LTESKIIELKEENDGMKKIIDQQYIEIEGLNKELKNMAAKLSGEKSSPQGPSMNISQPSIQPKPEEGITSESPLLAENSKLKIDLAKQTELNTKNQLLIEELNDHIGTLTAQLAKQQRLSTISASDIQIINENRDLKEQVEKLKGDLGRSDRQLSRIKDELAEAKAGLSQSTPIKESPTQGPSQSSVNEELIAQLNKTIVGLNEELLRKDTVIADLQSQLKARLPGTSTQPQPPRMVEDSTIKPADVEKIKSIIQTQYPGEELKVSVVLDANKNYQIDIERPSKADEKGVSEPEQATEKQRIKIPSQFFDQLKEVKIETNTDSTGKIVPKTIFSQSFIEGMKVTEVISKPEERTSMGESQIIIPPKNIVLDKDTAAFFELFKSGDRSVDLSQPSVPAQVKTSLVDPSGGKEAGLIQALLSAGISVEPKKSNPTVMQVSTYDKAGNPENKTFSLVDPETLEREQANLKASIANDIILALSKGDFLTSPQGEVSKATAIPGMSPGEQEIFRVDPITETRGSTTTDRIAFNLGQPQNSKVIQRLSISNLATEPDGTVKATVVVETADAQGKVTASQVLMVKKPDGALTIDKDTSATVVKASTQKLQVTQPELVSQELEKIAKLMLSKPPAIVAKPDQPLVMRPSDEAVVIEKIEQSKRIEKENLGISMLGNDFVQGSKQQASKINSQITERIIIDPVDISKSGEGQQTLSVLKEDFTSNPKKGKVEKIEIDRSGMLSSQVLGVKQAQLGGPAEEQRSVLEQVKDMNLSKLAQQEAIPALLMSKDPSVAVDSDMSQLLPFILPEGQEASSYKVKVTKDGDDLIYDAYTVVKNMGDEGNQTGIALVKQRTRIVDGNRPGSKWKIVRETISPSGDIQKEEFEVDKVAKADLFKKGFTQPAVKNKTSYRTYRDPKVVNTEGGKEKGLELFELPPSSMSWLQQLDASNTTGKQVIIHKDLDQNQEISKLQVPSSNNSIYELVEKIVMNKTTGQGVHTMIDKNASIIEEFTEGIDPRESQINKRVIIGPSNQIEDTEASMMQRSLAPQESDYFSFKDDPKDKSNRQTIVRESILTKEQSQIIVPIEKNFDLTLPSCLESYSIVVKNRNIERENDLASSSKMESIVKRNKCLQLMGSLEHFLAFLEPEVSTNPKKNQFYVALIKPDGLVLEKFQVNHGAGGVDSNLKLLSRTSFRCPSYTSRLESIEILKEVPENMNSTLELSYKLQKSDGQTQVITKELAGSKIYDRPLGSVSVLPTDLEGEFLRVLFATHEFGSQYVLIADSESNPAEWNKLEVVGTKRMAPSLKETWILAKGQTEGVAISRNIYEPNQIILEELEVKQSKQATQPGEQSKRNVPGLPLNMIPSLMKLKKKVKIIKPDQRELKLHESPVEDGVDSLKRLPLSIELKDLLDLVIIRNLGRQGGKPQNQLMLFSTNNQKANLKAVSYTPKSSSILPGSPIKDPRLVTEAEISKSTSMKAFASLVANIMADEEIIEQADAKADLNRDGYIAISKVDIDPMTSIKNVESYEVSVDPVSHLEKLAMLGQERKPEDRTEQANSASLLNRYLDFVCSLFKTPENLLKPNSILTQRIEGDQVIIRRADLLKDANSQDSSNLNLFVREELLLDKFLLDALSFTGSDNQASTNFNTDNAANIIENKIKEYRSSKTPGLVEKLTVRRSSLHEGSLAVDTIKIDAQNGKFENSIVERKIQEFQAEGSEEEFGEEKLSKTMALAIRSIIRDRHGLGNGTKSFGLIEEDQSGEVGVSQIQIGILPENLHKDALSYSVEDYNQKKIRKVTFDPTSSKFDAILGKESSIDAKSESIIIGGKVQVDMVKINPDLTQSKIDSFTLPKLPDWETQLNLIQLESAFREAGAVSSKPECFIQRRVEDDTIIYNIVQFEEKDGGYAMKILEHFSIPKKEESSTDKMDRPTMKLSEDYFYNRIASPRDDDMNRSQVKPGVINIRGEPGSRPQEPTGNIFQSMGFDPLTTTIDDDDSIIEKKSVRPLISRSSLMPSKKKVLTRPILTPLYAVLKSIDYLQLPPDVLKDTVMVQREENGKCIYELLKMHYDPLSGARTFDPLVRVITPREKTLFEPIEITREVIREGHQTKSVDQLRVTPDGDVTRLSSKQEPVTAVIQRRPLPSESIRVEDIIAHLSSFVKLSRQEPFYIKVIDDSQAKLIVETIEIVDKSRELVRERLEVMRDSAKKTGESNTTVSVVRTITTPEGQVIENLEYQKADTSKHADPTSTVTVGKGLVSIIGSKRSDENPIKPYKNLSREQSIAEQLGVQPTIESKPVDIEQIIDIVAKEAGNDAYILSQTVDKDKKIIHKYKVPEGNQPPELVEKFTLDLTQGDIKFKPGTRGSQIDSSSLAITSLAKYLIRGEKTSDGTTKVRVFKVVDQQDINKVSNKLAKPLTEEQKKQWKVIITSFENQIPAQDNQPIALLEVQELEITPSGQTANKNNVLGEVVGLTKDGEIIYEKQVDPKTAGDNKVTTSSGPGLINVQPITGGPRESKKDLNMFGSMVGDSGVQPPFQIGASQQQGTGGGMNAFGSMTDLGSETEPAGRPTIIPGRSTQQDQGYTFVVHPAPEQATPQQLAKFYEGQVNDNNLSPDDKSKVLNELLSKLRASVSMDEAENIRKELEEKDKQISALANSNATADFGEVLSSKDSELKRLREDKRGLEDQISSLQEMITSLRTTIVLEKEQVATRPGADSTLSREVEILANEMIKKNIIREPSSLDPTMTLVNKAYLKDCIIATWQLLDERDKTPQTPSFKQSSQSPDDKIIQRLKEENSELQVDIEKGLQERKTLKDRISELETERIKSLGIGGPTKPQEPSTGQIQADSYMTRSIGSLLDSFKDKGVFNPASSTTGDLVPIERSLLKTLIQTGEDAIRQLSKTEGQVKDQQAEIGSLQGKLKNMETQANSELAKKIDDLERELQWQRDQTRKAEDTANATQQANNKLKNDFDDYKMKATRELALIDNDVTANNQELEKLRDQVKQLRAEVDDKDKRILGLMSVQTKTPGLDQEKEYLKDEIAKFKRSAEKSEDDNRKLEAQLQDVRGQLKSTELRSQQIENIKAQEISSLQKIIDNLKADKESLAKQHPPAPTQDSKVEIDRLEGDVRTLSRTNKELESSLKEIQQSQDKEHELNKELKDKISTLELKLVEISSPQKKMATFGGEAKEDPILTKLLDDSFKAVQSVVSVPPKAGSENLVMISSQKVERLNSAIAKLLQAVKEEQEKQRELDHKLKLAIQNNDRLSNQSAQKDLETSRKIENLTKDLDESNQRYKEAMSNLQSLKAPIQSPERVVRPTPAEPDQKRELEQARLDLKAALDRISHLETEISVLRSKEMTSSSPKKEVSKPRADGVLEAVVKEAREAGCEVSVASGPGDSEVADAVVAAVVKTIRLLIAERKKVIEESVQLNKDLIAANERIGGLQKSLIAEGEAHRTKVEEKDNEIYKLNSDLTKLAQSIKEQQAGINPEKEKNLEQMMKLKDSELGRLRAESENLREALKDLKDANNNLELQLIESAQQKELIRSEILKLTKSQPDEIPKAEQDYLIALFNAIIEKGIIDQPKESDLLYKIPVTTFSAMMKSMNGLLDKVNQTPPPTPSSDGKVQELSFEIANLKNLLNEERDAREKDRKDKERKELEWKRKEEEFMRQLERSVSLESMNEKVGRLKTELDEKKQIISGLERETKSLMNDIKTKETEVGNLDKALSEKSQKLIEFDNLKTRLKEVEDERKRQEDKEKRDKEMLEEEIKKLKSEAQIQKIALEGANTRTKDLENQVSLLQNEILNKKKTSGEGSADQLNEALRAQSTLIASLRDKESQASQTAARLTKEKEQVVLALEESERTIEQLRKIENESQKQILDMYDQIDKINEELTSKQREVLEAEKELDNVKARQRQSSLSSSSNAETDEQRARLARLEADLQKRRASESELLDRLAKLQDEVRQERGKRTGTEAELESKRAELRTLSADVVALQTENRRLGEKNLELGQKLLVVKGDAAVDEKFSDLEDQMQRLKMHNEQLNSKVKELNDDVRNKNIRERSLSKENTELKEKIKNEEIAKIRRNSTVSSSPKRETENPPLPPRTEKEKPSIDYGPVHDLKLKNVTLQNEINTLKNKIKEMETKEKRDQSMINILRGSDMKDSQRKTMREETPERRTVRPFLPEGEGLFHETGLDNIEISLMRDSYSKMSPDRGSSKAKLAFDQEPQESDYIKLREELREIREENHRLTNYVSLLKSELITVAHHKVPPELQSPMSKRS